ncbi:embryonic polarity protein dorsal-like [Pseudomyrmex gracilis]|uniref:embryonic polarity protein dorsal-like n=1 Tax=Pseudomyrmex gracilis TaxID=219809 RepID=UPI000994E625|nr:embryonic polarity protein dorsal-like [Pseudomyrmex gracilis]
MNRAPQVKILEQPARHQTCCSKQRYVFSPSIDGVHSRGQRKTFPVVQIRNWKGPLKIIVSCVTKDPPHYPHPFRLVGEEKCANGVYVELIPKGSGNKYVILSDVGIESVTGTDVANSIGERMYMNEDPFNTGFRYILPKNDQTMLRLCAHVYLQGTQKDSYDIALAPVVSKSIHIIGVKKKGRSFSTHSSSSSSEDEEPSFPQFAKIRVGLEDSSADLDLQRHRSI